MFKSFTTSQTKPTSYREEIVARKRLYRPPVTESLQLWIDSANTRGTTVTGKSRNNCIGTLNNGVINNNGKYFSFDGVDDYISTTGYSVDRTLVTSELTVFAVARWDGNQTHTYRKHIFGIDNGGYDWQFGVQGTNWHVFTGGGAFLGKSADSDWHVIYATWGASIGTKMYVDSDEVISSTAAQTSHGPSSSEFWIGASPWGRPGEPFPGDIASVLVYDRYLSDRELQYNYELLRQRIPA